MKTHVAGHVRQNTGQCHNQPSQTRKNLKNDTVYMQVQERRASCQLSMQCRALGCYVVKGPTLAQMLYFTTTTELNLDPDLGITGTHVCGIS